MGKTSTPRALPDSEAKAISRMLRVSPQKLNLLAQLIRGKKVGRALADLEFSRKRIALDVRKCLQSAIANAENNHDLDVDDLADDQGADDHHHQRRGRHHPAELMGPQHLYVLVIEPHHRDEQSEGQGDQDDPRDAAFAGEGLDHALDLEEIGRAHV